MDQASDEQEGRGGTHTQNPDIKDSTEKSEAEYIMNDVILSHMEVDIHPKASQIPVPEPRCQVNEDLDSDRGTRKEMSTKDDGTFIESAPQTAQPGLWKVDLSNITESQGAVPQIQDPTGHINYEYKNGLYNDLDPYNPTISSSNHNTQMPIEGPARSGSNFPTTKLWMKKHIKSQYEVTNGLSSSSPRVDSLAPQKEIVQSKALILHPDRAILRERSATERSGGQTGIAESNDGNTLPLIPDTKATKTSEVQPETSTKSDIMPRKPWYKRIKFFSSRSAESKDTYSNTDSSEVAVIEESENDDVRSTRDLYGTENSSSSPGALTKREAVWDLLKKMARRDYMTEDDIDEMTMEGCFITAFVIKGGETHQIPYNGQYSLRRSHFQNLDSATWWKEFAFLSQSEIASLSQILTDDDEYLKTLVRLQWLRKLKLRLLPTADRVLVAIVSNTAFSEASTTDDSYEIRTRDRRLGIFQSISRHRKRILSTGQSRFRARSESSTVYRKESARAESTTLLDFSDELILYSAYTIRIFDPNNLYGDATSVAPTVTKEGFSEADILQRINALNTKGPQLIEKKLHLLAIQQQEITKLLERISAEEKNTSFAWSLAQIDDINISTQGLRPLTVYLRKVSVGVEPQAHGVTLASSAVPSTVGGIPDKSSPPGLTPGLNSSPGEDSPTPNLYRHVTFDMNAPEAHIGAGASDSDNTEGHGDNRDKGKTTELNRRASLRKEKEPMFPRSSHDMPDPNILAYPHYNHRPALSPPHMVMPSYLPYQGMSPYSPYPYPSPIPPGYSPYAPPFHGSGSYNPEFSYYVPAYAAPYQDPAQGTKAPPPPAVASEVPQYREEVNPFSARPRSQASGARRGGTARDRHADTTTDSRFPPLVPSPPARRAQETMPHPQQRGQASSSAHYSYVESDSDAAPYPPPPTPPLTYPGYSASGFSSREDNSRGPRGPRAPGTRLQGPSITYPGHSASGFSSYGDRARGQEGSPAPAIPLQGPSAPYPGYSASGYSSYGGNLGSTRGPPAPAIPLQRPRVPYPEYYDGRAYNPLDLGDDDSDGNDIVQKLLMDWTPAGESQKGKNKEP